MDVDGWAVDVRFALDAAVDGLLVRFLGLLPEGLLNKLRIVFSIAVPVPRESFSLMLCASLAAGCWLIVVTSSNSLSILVILCE